MENLGRVLTTEVLAERAGMTPRSFHRHFVARTGVTPAEAIERLRLDRARMLLDVVRLPLATVAEQSGFGSVERLRRAFKRRFGVSPRDYAARSDAAQIHSWYTPHSIPDRQRTVHGSRSIRDGGATKADAIL
jgi:transcriptional regulator GlxA family with amidase domain